MIYGIGPAEPGQTAPQTAPLPDWLGQATQTPLADGGMLLDLPDEQSEPSLESAPFDANLAEFLPEDVLVGIATDLIEGYEADLQSNDEYFRTLDAGLDLLGLKVNERPDWPFKGASGAQSSLLIEAAVRFYANASAELLPAGGPVRSQVNGDGGARIEAAAKRKQDWLNFYLTKRDRGYYPDARQGIFLTGLMGSTFRKVYPCPVTGQPRSRVLMPKQLIVSAATVSLDDAPRITQVDPIPDAEMRRLQILGFYRDIQLGEPEGEDAPVDALRNAQIGISRSDRPEDQSYIVLHVYALLDIAGLEHQEDGETTGLPLPYCVSIDKDSQKVLRLVRHWDEKDPLFLPKNEFVHQQYLPGIGFYGMGLIHLLGSNTDTLRTMLRQAVNSFTLNSFPGGFRVRGVKGERNDDPIGPCEFREIDTGGQPIGNAVMPMPYRDVPPSFSVLYEAIETAAQRLGGTADMAVGDGREDALPGTVIALIEKATKVESAVIKALHSSQAQELRMIADLFGQDQTAQYPYVINGRRGQAMAADFQDNDDVTPVSDPNIPTQTQRLAEAQAIMTLAQQSNGIMDLRAAGLNFLRTLGKTDAEINELVPPQQAGFSGDPMTEFQTLISGGKIQVRPDQAHQAHITAHMAQLQQPSVAQHVGPQLVSHIADHYGLMYRQMVCQASGLNIPLGTPLPPQQENQVAMAVAQVAQQVSQQMTQLAPAMGLAKPGAQNHDMGPVQAQIEMARIAADRESDQLKNEQDLRQSAIDWSHIKQNAVSSDADRVQKTRDNAAKLASEMMGVQTAGISAHHGTVQAGIGAMAGMHAAHHSTHQAAFEVGGLITAERERTKQAEHGVEQAKQAAKKQPRDEK